MKKAIPKWMITIMDSPLQYTAASMAFWFGLWLLMPGESYQSGPAWRALIMLLPENHLGLIMVAIGMFQLFAVVRARRNIGAVSALVAIALWSTIVYSFWLSAPMSTATPIYSHIVGINAIIFLRLAAK